MNGKTEEYEVTDRLEGAWITFDVGPPAEHLFLNAAERREDEIVRQEFAQ